MDGGSPAGWHCCSALFTISQRQLSQRAQRLRPPRRLAFTRPTLRRRSHATGGGGIAGAQAGGAWHYGGRVTCKGSGPCHRCVQVERGTMAQVCGRGPNRQALPRLGENGPGGRRFEVGCMWGLGTCSPWSQVLLRAAGLAWCGRDGALRSWARVFFCVWGGEGWGVWGGGGFDQRCGRSLP